MKIGMVGLGRMGAGITRRLLRGGHEVAAFDLDQSAVAAVAAAGAEPANSLDGLVDALDRPRAVWVMVPAGAITDRTIADLGGMLASGDAIIDGGNSRYTTSMSHAASLREKDIAFIDAGTSGGVWGLEEGFCLMIGATTEAFERLEPIFKTLAPEGGYAHVGPPGAGHFTKMVHNGVEYALMQAYGEGMELLNAGAFDLDLAQISELWRHGSVVRSWLLDLTASALAKNPALDGVSPFVEDSGEGRWAVQTAIENAVPAPTIALSLFARFASRDENSFASRLLAALRHEFGGHEVRPGSGS